MKKIENYSEFHNSCLKHTLDEDFVQLVKGSGRARGNLWPSLAEVGNKEPNDAAIPTKVSCSAPLVHLLTLI